MSCGRPPNCNKTVFAPGAGHAHCGPPHRNERGYRGTLHRSPLFGGWAFAGKGYSGPSTTPKRSVCARRRPEKGLTGSVAAAREDLPRIEEALGVECAFDV